MEQCIGRMAGNGMNCAAVGSVLVLAALFVKVE
jgi:hypothetical protein